MVGHLIKGSTEAKFKITKFELTGLFCKYVNTKINTYINCAIQLYTRLQRNTYIDINRHC